MRSLSLKVAVSLCAAVVLAPAALAQSPAKTPMFEAGEPSCRGLVVAFANHASGVFGPSGNSKASAGPGVFLRSETPEAIREVRETYC